MPARTEPVMATSSGVGWAVSASPVLRSPSTTLKTPGGRMPRVISASSSVDSGVESLGFSTIVLPAASAGPIFHTAMLSG